MLRFFAPTKNKLLTLVGVALVSCATFYILLNTARQEALNTFNKHMAKQTGFNGTVNVDALYPDFKGNVKFHNLQLLHNDEKILYIPYGRLKLKLWDIVTRTISINSIEELELNDVDLCLRFDKNMHMDLAAHDDNVDRHEIHQHKPTQVKFLNIKDKLPNTMLILNKADITVDHNGKQYTFLDSNCKIHVREHQYLDILFDCNNFGGSIEGEACNFSGTIDLANNKHKAHLNLSLYDVVPKSLGLGKLSNPVTIFGEVKGDLAEPAIDGAISMKRLDIPPMSFRNLTGNYHYENGIANFPDVQATLSGGPVDATGLYNFNKRTYAIHAVGYKIEVSSILKHSNLKGPANIDLHMYAVPEHDKTLLFGDFAAGPGRFVIFPFKSMTGTVNNQNKRLDVRDIVITTEAGTLTSDYLTLKDHRVSFGPMFIDYGDGKKTLLHNGK